MNRLIDKMGYRSVNSHCQWITLAALSTALSTALSSTFGLIWTEKAPAFVKVHRSIQVWRMIPRQDLTGSTGTNGRAVQLSSQFLNVLNLS